MSQIGRFFRPKRLLVPAALFLAAAVFDGNFIYRLLVDDVLMVGFQPMCAGPVLFVVGIASFAWVFPKGCKPCGVLLVNHFGTYSPDAFNALAAAIAQPNAQTSAQLAPYQGTTSGSPRALVRLELCPSCQQVGGAKVELQTHHAASDDWDTDRSTPEVAVTPQNAAALRALCA